ncbi:bifunctional tRNA (5-methylaminomethyl-2-thiouridine)(34)-methyltransferase MnmD/FAD-dependent 5-carboxymethylaminomethyl-2-thiouridine(34) oxidoreductase MnmC [Planctobacterium marinum]|uniref:tRNA 5-methylaminomethyl-2-thiouridine biosynthesis bifunctional protein MnmC n=1 Tax=Planctobacterium marinum TaxID=1631968 RepID=A0AA48HIB2_9ALTE|nr:tRNA 5-methylaminomethyl-2-thiouridine biosynthesis bifunctional protein MnmC [Planctobacterium marinum]
MKLKTASLSFNASGTPTSAEFDDVYFSNDNGLAESKYVFFDHNYLNSRWFSHSKNHFCIAETGFGTGLNFLLTWQCFRDFLHQKNSDNTLKQLHFVTTEKFPITKEELKLALAQWPELKEFSEQLLVQYPILTPGCHRLVFEQNQIILDLWLGDIEQTLPTIMTYPDGLVDAWYLDGFAPSKNPDMWQDTLFANMARLSKPGCTFATFTAAGIVKRGLRDNGFIVKKAKGFGKKRDMLVGYFSPDEAQANKAEELAKQNLNTDTTPGISENTPFNRPHAGPYQRTGVVTSSADKQTVAVIGAGLAGAQVALALQNRGYQVEVYCAEAAPAAGASGNHIGGFYPSLNADFSLQSQLYCHAFSYAKNHYRNLLAQGAQFGHQWCGVFFPGFSDEVKKRQQKLIENQVWPEDLVHYIDAHRAAKTCGLAMPYDGLFMPHGGWVNPKELVEALLNKAMNAGAKLITEYKLKALQQRGTGWTMDWHGRAQSQADIVVLATGAGTLELQVHSGLSLNDIPFTCTRGQVELLPDTPRSVKPKTMICHKGYFTPFYQQKQAMGATFDKVNRQSQVTESDTEQNFATIEKALTNCDWVQDLPAPVESRAALRLSLPDHKPVMGAVPHFDQQKTQYAELYKAWPASEYPLPANYENLYLLAGLGSHGLCTSPILAETLACQISGEPLPLNQELLASVSPNRFFIRDLIRRKV